MIWILAGLLAAAAAGVWVYNFMEGETLIRDLIDEVRLSRTELKVLDRAWAAAPLRSDCVVSMTSLPSRLPFVAATLKSLLRQKRLPARIRLNLPAFSRREQTAYAIPEWLRDLNSVEIVPCEDYGPATKLIPSLVLAPDTKIVVVDDDRIYPANLIADLEAAADTMPDAAVGFSGWIAPRDLTDRPTTILTNIAMTPPVPIRARRVRKPRAVDMLQGLSGYLVRPKFFDLAKLTDYAGAPEAAFFVDDVWIGAHCNAPKYVIPARRAGYPGRKRRAFYKQTSLGLVNRGGGDVNKRNNTIMLRHFAGRWKVGGA
ncbi:MAG TPA: hypothetical protein VG891_02625 [Rhizomicrobium sp.]|nr:hypothetical protein [Rhizomicrobium sp.]